MAETAGPAVTVTSVAAVFQNCIQCFDEITYGKKFGKDYENALLTLDISQQRLRRWAKAVGLEESKTFPERDLQIMDKVLGQILAAFKSARGDSKKDGDILELMNEVDALATIPSDQKLSNNVEKLHHNFKRLMEDRQKRISFREKDRWTMYESTHFTELVQKISRFADVLDKAFPQSIPKQMQYAKEELKNVAHSAQEAETVMKAAKQADKVLEEAAKEIKLEYEGSTYENIRVNGSVARFGHDVAFGARTGGTKYSGLVIENNSFVHAGNVYRGPGSTPAAAAQIGIEGVFGAPPRRGTGAFARRRNPEGPEVEEYDDGAEDDFLPRHPFLLDRIRTDTGFKKSGRTNTGAQER